MTLFNHRDPELQRIQTIGAPISLAGLENYAGRCLGITKESDAVQLPLSIQSEWVAICAHYRRIGLKHTTEVIWDDRFEVAADFPEHDLSVFIFSPEMNAVRPNPQYLWVVQKMNSKNRFVELCRELGVQTPDTFTYGSRENVDPEILKYPAYLKANISVSGLGVVRCSNSKELRQNLGLISEGEVQIQQEVAPADFLNLTYDASSGNLKRITATKQILKGFSHNGNIFPSGCNDPWLQADLLAQHLVRNSMDGVFGFDFAVTPKGPMAIECNPRYNGSVYPAIIAEKLDIPCWRATNFSTKHRILDKVDLTGLEFDTNTKTGVVLVNWGAVLDAKLGLLLAGTPDQQDWLAEELNARL